MALVETERGARPGRQYRRGTPPVAQGGPKHRSGLFPARRRPPLPVDRLAVPRSDLHLASQHGTGATVVRASPYAALRCWRTATFRPPASPIAPARTCCVTPSPPMPYAPGPTCGRCRNCWPRLGDDHPALHPSGDGGPAGTGSGPAGQPRRQRLPAEHRCGRCFARAPAVRWSGPTAGSMIRATGSVAAWPAVPLQATSQREPSRSRSGCAEVLGRSRATHGHEQRRHSGRGG